MMEKLRLLLEYWKPLADWGTAVGTLTAVVVSLYISRRATAQRARVRAGHRIIIGTGSSKPYPEVIVFGIVNLGERPLRITHIGWKAGLFRKRFALQRHDEPQSSPLPIELSHGQEAQWVVPLSLREEPWMTYFARDMLMPHWRTSCFTLRARFFSSVGTVFSARPEPSLMTKLLEACDGLAKQGVARAE
jgi:hypothetical protein